MAVTGGFAQFEKLRKAVSKAKLDEAKKAMLKNFGEQAVTLVRQSFRDSKAPDGTAWAPLKSRKGKALLRTGRLRASVSWLLTPNGFRLTDNVAYAAFQQLGTAGRKADSTRHAAIDGSGKFMSKRKAGRMTVSKATVLQVGIKTLHFKAGTGGIPARPFMPNDGELPPAWEKAFDRVATRMLKKLTT